MKKQMGRDDARERIKKAAPSHTAEMQKFELEKNKKQEAKTSKGHK